MSVYLSNPDAPPDSAFEPGALHHIVIGNTGRLLDTRRTPVSVVDVRVDTGQFVVRIDDFEDRGAEWVIPFESVSRYQFAAGARRAPADDVRRFEEAIHRFDRPLRVPRDETALLATDRRLEEARAAADTWLAAHSQFFAAAGTLPDPATRTGDTRLQADLRAYLERHDLADMEEAFARRYVSNPHSGEMVKGHCIVIAGLGLASYTGTGVRDPALFGGDWSRARRADHVIVRMGFVSAMFARCGRRRVVLYRGMSTEGPLERRDRPTLVSATFDPAVAESHFESGTPEATRVLQAQAVPTGRIFMTYLETAAMNTPFKEAEAVLLHGSDDVPF
jgi:hypothetical protein